MNGVLVSLRSPGRFEQLLVGECLNLEHGFDQGRVSGGGVRDEASGIRDKRDRHFAPGRARAI